jgi:hypothetical protein
MGTHRELLPRFPPRLLNLLPTLRNKLKRIFIRPRTPRNHLRRTLIQMARLTRRHINSLRPYLRPKEINRFTHVLKDEYFPLAHNRLRQLPHLHSFPSLTEQIRQVIRLIPLIIS